MKHRLGMIKETEVLKDERYLTATVREILHLVRFIQLLKCKIKGSV